MRSVSPHPGEKEMPSLIELSIPNYGVRARASILRDEAPETANIMLRSMPIQVDLYHCIRCGREVFALLDEIAEIPPMENLTIWPRPGDLWFLWLPSDYEYNPPGFVAPVQGTLDLVVWYGADACAFDPDYKPLAGIHWATITENLEGFARACEELWLDGVATLEVRVVG